MSKTNLCLKNGLQTKTLLITLMPTMIQVVILKELKLFVLLVERNTLESVEVVLVGAFVAERIIIR